MPGYRATCSLNFYRTIVKSNRVLKNISLDLHLGGIIFGALIAIYSLILAFVVVVGWQQYQVTGDRIEAEAAKLYNVYRSTFAYTDPGTGIDTAAARKIRTEIKNYIRSVQDDEWAAMEHDSLSAIAQKSCNNVWHIIIHDIKPVSEQEKIWYASTIQNMNQFTEARHFRLSDMDSSIPSLMWVMLLSGAVIIIVFSMLLNSENKPRHLLKVLMISVMIIFSLLLVYALDHPFKGILKLAPKAFSKISVGEH
jgi:hypothetical protein